MNEQTRQPVENPATRALREGVIVGLANHTVLIAKDGTERPIDDSAAPIRCKEGEIVGCVLVFRDVTERRREEAALRESELRYRLVGQAANDAIWDWNLVTNQVTWNEGVQACFGYTAEQVGVDASWWVEHIHPDDRDRVAHGIHAAIDGGQELWSGEYRFRRADGSYAEVFDRGRVVRDGGRPVRMVGSMLDLTERKRAEAALREKDELLRLAQRAAEAGVWGFDIATGEAHWSEGCHRLYGTDPATFRPSLDAWVALLQPNDREEAAARVRQAIERREEFDFEFRIDHPAKGGRWLWEVGKAEFDDQGRAVRMAGISRGRDRPPSGGSGPAGERGPLPQHGRQRPDDAVGDGPGRLLHLPEQAVVRVHRQDAGAGLGVRLAGERPPRRRAAGEGDLPRRQRAASPVQHRLPAAAARRRVPLGGRRRAAPVRPGGRVPGVRRDRHRRSRTHAWASRRVGSSPGPVPPSQT